MIYRNSNISLVKHYAYNVFPPHRWEFIKDVVDSVVDSGYFLLFSFLNSPLNQCNVLYLIL